MSLNTFSNPRLFLGKSELLDFESISYSNSGNNTISTLNVTLTDPERDILPLMAQEVVFYLNYGSADNVPFFRGYIKEYTPTDKKITLIVHDVLSFLAGKASPPITLTDNNNYDGFTLTQMLHDFIETTVNKNRTIIGLDMLTETNPPVTMTGYRGKNVTPLKAIKDNMPKDKSSETQVRAYKIVVRDDGVKSNIIIIKEQDIDSMGITFSFNDGIKKLNYKRRPTPNYYQHEVNGTEMVYQHHTLPSGINMGKLEGKFDYPDQARQEAFFTSVQEDGKAEITIDVTKGHYLELGTVINLSLREYPEITGKHRIVAKKININKSNINCLLTLDKDKITLGDYINSS